VTVHTVQFTASAHTRVLFEEALEGAGCAVSSEEIAAGRFRVRGVISGKIDPTQLTEAIRAAAAAGRVRPPKLVFGRLGRTDWTKKARKAAPPVRAGAFLVHERRWRGAKTRKIAIAVDAGLAFGSGRHETTRGILASMGLSTIGDVARYPESALIARLGNVTGPHLAALARGEDSREVIPETDPVSIGHQETFDDDIDDKGELAVILLDQADRVARRLREAELRARAVVLIVKYDDFRQITRRTTLDAPTSDGGLLARTAIELLAKVSVEPRKGGRVRLCGISATSLEPRDAPRQLGFDEAAREKADRLNDTVDKLSAKFGKAVIRRAVHVKTEADD
jgi:hypothetical protein